jgi:hypothetical protein
MCMWKANGPGAENHGTTTFLSPAVVTALAAFLFSWLAIAQDSKQVQCVLFKEEKVLVVRDGLTNVLEKELGLPNEIKVMTNGTFRVKAGKERHFQEGQVLTPDGMMSSPDGRFMPVLDHVMMRRGKMYLTVDGDTSTLQTEVVLGDGSRITPDGYQIDGYGRQVKLMDGQMFRLDDGPIPVKDTVTLRDGKVWVQKDGSRFEVAYRRSLMMNDGTKVFGDGTIVMRNGQTRHLAEGEILTVEGVVRK